MMPHRFFLTITFILIGFPNLAIAAIESLDYKEKIGPSTEYQINLFLENSYGATISQYDIARVDLNNDNIDEYILRRKECSSKRKQCVYLILAAKEDEIITLGEIKAQNLMIGETSSYGIKDILAFANEVNDYDFSIYMWSPFQKMYILEGEQGIDKGK